MQSPRSLYPNEDVSARSVTSSRTGGESQASYQRAAAASANANAHRQSMLNVSPSKIQSVRRPSEIQPNSGRSVGSSNSGQGWTAAAGGPAAAVVSAKSSPAPRVPASGSAVGGGGGVYSSSGGPGAVAAMSAGHDEDYMLGLMSEPTHAYPAYAAAPGLMLATGSITPTNAPLSVSEAGGAGAMSPGPMQGPAPSALSPQGDDLVHEVLAVNTLAMQRCREELLDEATHLLNEAYLKLEANGSSSAGVDTSANHRPSSGGSTGSRGPSVTAVHYGADHEASAGPAITDQQLLDELRSITLNNMGVVECHRGQPRQALSHFEAARQLEENWNMGSPSVALNTCAAYNALRMYDKATAAALETIDMLRALAVQRKRQRLLQRRQIASQQPVQTRPTRQARKREAEEEALLLQGASDPVIADSENDALWGAAWHNLAVAQINTAMEARHRAGTSNSTRQADSSEMTNALIIFQNAMRATLDLLGPKHPMTKAVVQTYRDARKALRSGGAFKQHRGQMTAPLPPVDPRDRATEEMSTMPAPGKTRHGTVQSQKKDLTITFRGDATGGEKLTERMGAAPYPGAKTESYAARKNYTPSSNFKGETPRTMTNLPASRSTSQKRGTASSRSRSPGKGKAWSRGPLRSMPLGETLMQASELYGNPHPLLYSSARGGGTGNPEAIGADNTQGVAASTWTEGSHAAHHSGARYESPTPPAAHDGVTGSKMARSTRPRPPLPENLSNEAYYEHYLALLDERDRRARARDAGAQAGATASGAGTGTPATTTSGRLPVIRGPGEEGNAAGAYPDLTPGTRTDAPIIMHHPPASRSAERGRTAGPRDESSVATQPAIDAQSNTTNRFSPDDHARYLLLAQPPAPLSLGSPSSTAREGHSTSAANHAATSTDGVAGPTAAGAAGGGGGSDALEAVSPVPSQPALPSADGGADASPGAPARELFDAMWVTTDETMLLRQGKRDFGRPAYYVPTTTLLQTYKRQEEAEAAERRASGQHVAGPDTRTAVMYYTDDDDAGDGQSSQSMPKDGDEIVPRARANTAQHDDSNRVDDDGEPNAGHDDDNDDDDEGMELMYEDEEEEGEELEEEEEEEVEGEDVDHADYDQHDQTAAYVPT